MQDLYIFRTKSKYENDLIYVGYIKHYEEQKYLLKVVKSWYPDERIIVMKKTKEL